MVEIAGKGLIKISELKKGDFVKSYDYKNKRWEFSRFVIFLHKDEDMIAEYILVKTSSGKSISISPLHLISKQEEINSNKVELVFARDLKSSDYLITEDSVEQIAEIKYVYEKGAYAPLTESGTISVNQIAASCYAHTKYPGFIHLLFQPIIQYSKYFSIESPTMDYLFQSESKEMILPKDAFWYTKFLFNLLPYVPYSSSFIIF